MTYDMQPNQANPQLPTNYLDQIAPKPQKAPSIFSKKPVFLGAIGLVLVLLLCVLGLIVNVTSSAIAPTERLAARLLSTKDTSDKATNNIKSPKLRALNSALNIYLTDTIRDITPILEKNDVKVEKLPNKVTLAESNTEMLATLEDARLNVRFDRVYANEMSAQLENILILMKKIYKSTNSAQLKSYLDGAIDTLEPTQKEFADFNDTTS